MEIKVDKLNINGEGISIIDGKKCCVKGVLPDEIINVNILKEKENFCQCQLEKIIKPSTNRVISPCIYSKSCGGCDLIFANNTYALELKRQSIQEYFSEYIKDDVQIIPSENNLNYRNKVSFLVENGRIGLQQENTNKLVEIKSCKIANDYINLVLDIFRKYFSEIRPKSTSEKISKEYLFFLSINHLVVRAIDNQVIIVIVCNRKTIKIAKLLIMLLQFHFRDNFGLYVNVNKVNSKNILSDEWHHIYGKEYLKSNVNGIEYYVYPHSFMQINDDAREKLYSYIAENVDHENVVEGYSGAGLLSAIMSKKAKSVISVEINKDGTKSAQRTKEVNNIENLENINGDFKEIFPILSKKYDKVTLVVDPPRNGLSKEVLDTIRTSLPDKIIYISCSPYTLKQNIGYIAAYYNVNSLRVFDMFPQTSKVECVAILEKNKNNS